MVTEVVEHDSGRNVLYKQGKEEDVARNETLVHVLVHAVALIPNRNK